MFVLDMNNAACIIACTAVTVLWFLIFVFILYGDCLQDFKKFTFPKIISSPKQILNVLWRVVLAQYCKFHMQIQFPKLFWYNCFKSLKLPFVDCWKVVKMLELATKVDFIQIESFTFSVLINPVHASLWNQIILDNYALADS